MPALKMCFDCQFDPQGMLALPGKARPRLLIRPLKQHEWAPSQERQVHFQPRGLHLYRVLIIHDPSSSVLQLLIVHANIPLWFI